MSSLPPRASLRIGIVAGTSLDVVPVLRDTLGTVDLLLHAGRIGGPAVYEELERLWPLQAVVATADYLELGDRLPETRLLQLGDLRILLTHLAGDPPRLLTPLERQLEREPVDLLVHGQPPQARAEWLGGLLVVAPGHAGVHHPGLAPTCALIEADGGNITAHVLEISGRPRGGPVAGGSPARVPRRLPR